MSSQLTATNHWTPSTPATPHITPQSHRHNDMDTFDTASVSSLPTYNQAMEAAVRGSGVKNDQKNAKKKIIPVQSDSSESSPSSPAESPQPQSMSLSSRYRLSQQSQPQSPPQDSGMMQLEVPSHQPSQGQA